MTEGFEPVVYRLSDMSGFEFEDAIQTVFERRGYDATVAERVADLGRDVIARNDEETIIVECKHTESKISRPDIPQVHSASVSFDAESSGSTRAIIVSTGGFTGPAREHASDLGDGTVELWDYPTLVERARPVDVYFPSEEAGTEHVFRAPRRDPGEVETLVDEKFLSALESEPRSVDEHSAVERCEIEEIPALVVEYSLDETFGTSTYPRLHRAYAKGRKLIPVDDTHLEDPESELWEDASFSIDCREDRSDTELATRFGIDPNEYETPVRRRIARRESATVHYTGRNNQSYSKKCRVNPEDVAVRSRQVLLHRQRVSVEIGPASHTLVVAEHRQEGSVPVDSAPLELYIGRQLWRGGSGILCNDCAEIIPAGADPPPVRCQQCSRTLCAQHHWNFPALLPGRDESLCSDCYRSQSASEPKLAETYDGSALTALIPPIGLADSGDWLLLSFLLLTIATAIGLTAIQGAAHTWTVVAYWISGLTWLGAGVWLALNIRRMRQHRQNLAELEGYQRVWE